MLLIGIAGNSLPEGVGVGGFVAIMGLAFLINGLFEQRSDSTHGRVGRLGEACLANC